MMTNPRIDAIRSDADRRPCRATDARASCCVSCRELAHHWQLAQSHARRRKDGIGQGRRGGRRAGLADAARRIRVGRWITWIGGVSFRRSIR